MESRVVYKVEDLRVWGIHSGSLDLSTRSGIRNSRGS